MLIILGNVFFDNYAVIFMQSNQYLNLNRVLV